MWMSKFIQITNHNQTDNIHTNTRYSPNKKKSKLHKNDLGKPSTENDRSWANNVGV